ncbi:hypothetical protein [Dyadobacter psychrotolerans]|uniref:Uncharacterized protein n=1 Tax=Dyadobacter psychrotolerans TaxID=2541721 RepID=A0A4R5DWC4_9BACT|nr:hypothetical protein [Dyadobacter psychrotolerans]TDE15575.1 hypothetical protein E0F88_13815 [Dyadobacter psychrotolerans]
MEKITNKIKLSGLFAVVAVATLTFASCSSEKKAEDTETTSDSTGQIMAPDTLTPPDSLPTVDTSASTRPEPRKT